MTSRRKLAAILFADIVGYTRQVNADEAKGLEHRREFEALARSAAVSHSGRVVKMIGDAAMLEFASAVEAVGCALDLQQQMADLDQRLGAGGQLRIRVGVHVGDVAEEDGDLYGNAVNIAQRVHDQAQPGGICITRDVYVQIRPIMKVRCEPAKRRPGKGMPEPIEVFSVIADLTGPLGDRRNGPARTHAWRSRPGLIVLGVLAIALAHAPVIAVDRLRARDVAAVPVTAVADADGIFYLVGRRLADARVMIEVGREGPVVPARTLKPDPDAVKQILAGPDVTEEAASLMRLLGRESDTVAVVTEDWMRSAQLAVLLEPRSVVPYLTPLQPRIRCAGAVRLQPKDEGRAEWQTEPTTEIRVPDPPSDAHYETTPFAVVGGRYAPGDDLPIGGRRLGASGIAFLGGLQMKTRRWSPDGVIAIVPPQAVPGDAPVVVVPEGSDELEAGTVTIAPRPPLAQHPPAGSQGQAFARRSPPGYREMMAGDHTAASSLAVAAIRANPDDTGALAMHAIAVASAGNAKSVTGETEALRSARASLNKASARAREASPTERGLILLATAVVAQRSGANATRVDEAYRSATEADPRLALAYLLWAQSLQARQAPDAARQVIRTGIRNTLGAAWTSRTYRDLAARLGIRAGQGERRPVAPR